MKYFGEKCKKVVLEKVLFKGIETYIKLLLQFNSAEN